MAEWEQSEYRIPDPLSVILTFSLITTFYLTETETITKNFQHRSLQLWVKILFPPQKCWFFVKESDDIDKIKRVLLLLFSKTLYMCVLTYQMSSFLYNSNRVYTGGNFTTLPLPENTPLISPGLGLK